MTDKALEEYDDIEHLHELVRVKEEHIARLEQALRRLMVEVTVPSSDTIQAVLTDCKALLKEAKKT